MDEENLKRLAEAFQKLTNSAQNAAIQVDEYGRELTAAEVRERKQREAEYAAVEKQRAEAKAAFDKVVANWAKFSKTTVRTVGSMTTQEGAFKTLADITGMIVKGIGAVLGNIPYVGGALKGMAEGAAEAIKLIAEQTAKAFATFGKISGSGVIQNFDDLRGAVKKTGLLYEQLEPILTQNSEALAALGSSALDGSKRLQNILEINNKSTENFTEQFAKIGISFAEFSEFQASYVAQQTKAGFLRGKDDAYIAAGARKYAEELDTISKLTGKNRKDIQKEQDKLLSDARYRATLVELEAQGPEGKAIAAELQRALSYLPDDQKEGFKNLIAGGGAVIDEASARFAMQMGLGGKDALKLAKGLLSGTVTAEQSFGEIADGSKAFTKEVSGLARLVGDDSALSKGFAGIADTALNAGKDMPKLKEEVEEARRKAMAAADPMAQAADQTQKLAVRMEQLLTSSDAVPKAIDFLAKRLNDFADFIEKQLLKDKPREQDKLKDLKLVRDPKDFEEAAKQRQQAVQEYERVKKEREQLERERGLNAKETLEARQAERRLLRDVNLTTQIEKNAAKKFGGTPGAPVTAPTAEPAAAPAAAPAKPATPAAAPAAAPTEVQKEPMSKERAMKLLTFTGGSGSKDSFDKLNPDIRDRFLDLLADPKWGAKNITINSALRSQEEQKALYDRWIQAGGGPDKPTAAGITTPAKPGPHNSHSAGVAIDVGTAGLAALESSGLLGKYGFRSGNTFKTPDPVHIQAIEWSLPRAEKGALVEPKQGGTLVQVAEAGKPEAIVPLPDGRSIPVSITNQKDSTIVKNLDAMSMKFDAIIDLLTRNNTIKDSIVNTFI